MIDSGSSPDGHPDGHPDGRPDADDSNGERAPLADKTQPFRLRELAPRLAQRRRRTTAAEVIVKRPRESEFRIALERSETVFGRDPGCDVVLPEKSVSSRHARIRRNAGGFFEIEDLGSTNGVIVDGERVTRQVLLDGDTFTLGDTRFSLIVAEVVGEGA